MATKKEKQELIDTLKFTPTTVRILIQGYGGEAYAGRVEREIYEYFREQRIDIEEYASAWDGFDDMPSEMKPFDPGAPFECDSIFHASGAELSDLNSITVEEVNSGKTLWEHNLGYSNLEEAGVTVNEGGGEDLDDLETGEVVFWGGQGEKGCFFDGELTLTAPFDPTKLTVTYENCNGWYIVNSIEYNGEYIEGTDGYSTTGKWSEYKWILGGDEEVYVDVVSVEDREDEGLTWGTSEFDPAAELEKIVAPYTVTDWFDKTINPAHKGEYEVLIDAPWPNGGPGMAEWTGRTWKHNGKKVAIHQWRGITENLST